MPSVASMILRASRDAARAARSAASAASRCAAVAACSGSGGAAASDPLLRSSSITAPPPRIPFDVDMPYTPCPAPGKVIFEAKDKDLELDEALWALYERWCKAFNQERDHEEMSRRFNEFKESVLLVDRTNKAGLPYKLEINKFADGKLRELCANKVFFDRYYQKSPNQSA